jgi:hypothetical protein
MSAPTLFAEESEWGPWTRKATTAELETERAKAWKIQSAGDCLRNQIQADFVIQTIDWELSDRYEETA